ncbi:MAG: Polyprenol monophosphomannose synthase [Syntrophomonadaceae bacterium]|nr:Polyprenol monophosphomannose synthase [Bacillota bacterium]
MKTVVLIPAFNEEKGISQLVKDLRTIVEEIIVVNDGSCDKTAAVAAAAGAKVISHKENKGKGVALRTGFQAVISDGADAVITMDGDGQHDWREVPKLIKKAEESGADIVIGDRMGDISSMPPIRILTNRLTSWFVSRLGGQKISDSQSGYRLIKREVLENVKLETAKYDLESEILIKASRQGYTTSSIPVKTIYYAGGVSKINPLMDTLRFARLIVRLM